MKNLLLSPFKFSLFPNRSLIPFYFSLRFNCIKTIGTFHIHLKVFDSHAIFFMQCIFFMHINLCFFRIFLCKIFLCTFVFFFQKSNSNTLFYLVGFQHDVFQRPRRLLVIWCFVVALSCYTI